MSDESRWSEDDRFRRSDEERGYDSHRERYRDAGWMGRGPGNFDRQYGDRQFGPYSDRQSGGNRAPYGRDYGEPYRGYGRSGGYGGPMSRGRSAGQQDRGWWERASDEVSSWFGDDDAERRRQMDAIERGHRGRGPKGYIRSDDRIREDVCDRLSDHPLVDASEISVAVAGSEVTLSGTVDTREERRLAEDCAERVSGVAHVQNNLRVAQQGGTLNTGMNRTGTGATAGTRSPGTQSGRASH